jgi:hypothetical protein
MVVGYFNVTGVSVFPEKTYPPLIVNPDAVLPLTIALQGLKPIARRNPEVLKALGLMKVQELPPCNPLERTKSRHVQVIEQFPGFCITEGPYHHL